MVIFGPLVAFCRVTFNVFTKLHNVELLNKAIQNIPLDVKVRIWPQEYFDTSKLCRPCEVFLLPELRLTWAQSMRAMMDMARSNGEEWVGHCHDDGMLSREDLQKLIDFIQDPPDDAYLVQSYNPHEPTYCGQIYIILNTKKYWEAGGHDTDFTLYWADIDFLLRQEAIGNKEYSLTTETLYHAGSATLHRNTELHKAKHVHYFNADKAYFQLKHPTYQIK